MKAPRRLTRAMNKLQPTLFIMVLLVVLLAPLAVGVSVVAHPLGFLALLFTIGLIIYTIFIGRDFFWEYGKKLLTALVAIYLIAFVSMSVMNRMDPDAAQSARPLIDFRTPGTLLVLTLAMITVLGFVITITRLQESHVRISNYKRLLARLDRMLRQVLWTAGGEAGNYQQFLTRLVRGRGEPVELKIMCTAPTLGNVTHHETFYPRLYNLWLRVANNQNITVDLICLKPGPAKKWHDIEPIRKQDHGPGHQYPIEEFAATSNKNSARDTLLSSSALGGFYKSFMEQGFLPAAVRRGFTEAYEIVNRLAAEENQNTLLPLPWPNEGPEPSFHLFWTSSRAIVAVPLDRSIRQGSVGGVTLIGYETTDLDVIDRLKEVFDEWKFRLSASATAAQAPAAPIAETFNDPKQANTGR